MPASRIFRFGAYEALCHCRLGNEKRARDLVRLETAERAQRQREPRLERERRVAAREDEAEPLVRNRGRVVHLVVRLCRFEPRQQIRLSLQVLLSPQSIDCTIPCHRHEPTGRVRGLALSRPALECDGDGVLKGVLGEVEVAEDADQGREHTAVLLAEERSERDAGGSGYPADASTVIGSTGRTSIEP